MRPFLRLAQIVLGPPHDHLVAMLNKRHQQFFESHRFRDPVIQPEHIGREGDLHGGMLVKLVEDYLGLLIPF